VAVTVSFHHLFVLDSSLSHLFATQTRGVGEETLLCATPSAAATTMTSAAGGAAAHVSTPYQGGHQAAQAAVLGRLATLGVEPEAARTIVSTTASSASSPSLHTEE
jgi:hypothetical protein